MIHSICASSCGHYGFALATTGHRAVARISGRAADGTRQRRWPCAIIAFCVVIPLWTSVLVRSYAWIVLLQRNGIINGWLKDFGLSGAAAQHDAYRRCRAGGDEQVLMPFIILPVYST